MIHDPQLLLLDEPTAGVDPIGSRAIRDIILQLKKMSKNRRCAGARGALRREAGSPATVGRQSGRSAGHDGDLRVPDRTLIREVTGGAADVGNLDFGRDILPGMVGRGCSVMAFPFRDRNSGAVKYWRDIGTLDSYFEAHMDLVAVSPIFNLYDTQWPIRTYQHQRPPAKTVFRDEDRKGEVLDSLVSSGCIISGARVEQSVLGPNVFVHSWAHLDGCVVFEDVEVGRHAKIRRAIIDKEVKIPAAERIGFDLARDRQRFTVTDRGVVVIPTGHVIRPA